MKPRSANQGIRRSICSTVAIPALVTVTAAGFVEPSVGAISAPDDGISNRCATDAPGCVGSRDQGDDVAEPCDARRFASLAST